MKALKRLISILILLVCGFLIYTNFNSIVSYVDKLLDKGVDYINKTGLTLLDSDGSLISEKSKDSLEDSGITGRDLAFEGVYYPYYTLITDNERLLYKQIYANVVDYQTTFVPVTTSNINEVTNALEAVYNDHPELFWMDTSYSYKYYEDNTCAQIILKFNETINYIDTAKANFDNKVNSIINSANMYDSNYEKEKYVHNAILNIVEYDVSAPMNQTAYSALVNGKTVCAGYARSFQYIMTKLEIPTYYVTGTAEEDHAWNIVKLSDGYYNVDLTWDDVKTNKYSYFNIEDQKFSKTHTRTRMSVNLPTCNGNKYLNR